MVDRRGIEVEAEETVRRVGPVEVMGEELFKDRVQVRWFQGLWKTPCLRMSEL
jgi:hypothetical protein